MTKWVYSFGSGSADGNAGLKNLLGGKGSNLAEMNNIGIPVPSGFTITTEVCNFFYENEQVYPKEFSIQLNRALSKIEKTTKMKFGDNKSPLLLSVRSGARTSMPGMMDTVLNLGLNDNTVLALSDISGDKRFAYDSYRRFIQMYGDVVLGIDSGEFEDIIEEEKRNKEIHLDTEVTAESWKKIIKLFKVLIKKVTNKDFPQDPVDQLWASIGAVLNSWMNQRAKTYRSLNNIPESWGTAVNVQSMVFGNMGEDCCTGVAFTRNPSTGENNFYGEYLVNAQGEDVVAGTRTPQNLTKKESTKQGTKDLSLEEYMPSIYRELEGIFDRLERHYLDMQDIEFTVQRDKLWILQTRAGKRTTTAAVKIAIDMEKEGLIDKNEALSRINPLGLDQLLHPTLDPQKEKKVLTKGLPASPGAASGKVVFDSEDAVLSSKKGESIILVRMETSPEDIHGMHAARGILTSRGGMTSHAAVVARGMGRPCVTGAGDLVIDHDKREFRVDDFVIKNNEVITIDGGSGEVILGEIPTVMPGLSENFFQLMKWADEKRKLKIRANAETSRDVKTALDFGAEGIGLCRTEHMFFDANRILAVREMIFAETEGERRSALNKIKPMQKNDFKEILSLMGILPVTIRLLDPPLHEFLPKEDRELEELSSKLNLNIDTLQNKVKKLEEQNPMLGHRGCRLGVTYPEIYEMQAQAIFESVIEVSEEKKIKIIPEIMVPFIISANELKFVKNKIAKVADEMKKLLGTFPEYLIGTMIELPSAALNAKEIALEADFFSFGTNDLTQTTLGISRDDSSKFLSDYIDENIIEHDPFVTIDEKGVGKLVLIAKKQAIISNKGIKLGICGEHGGDPQSIDFFSRVGLDYVSCSPYRIPIARLAAAQAEIQKEKK
ncbi:MAG: Pyruvate, phosphate dikinase [Alphaproteobacteria bacterium MarineAlpha9_Bin2]|nr:MAG: Pyruvate, phosphate dikinase [Alphaproteobacteria bacterium MarineAlpha9_Bin2]